MESKEYWKKRALERAEYCKAEEVKIIKEINRAYEKAFLESYRDLYQFYLDYCDKNGLLTIQEAMLMLPPVNLKQNTEKIRELAQLYEKYELPIIKQEMKFLQSRGKVTRLQGLCDSINVNFIKATAKENEVLAKRLSKMYKREFKESLASVGEKAPVIPAKQVESALSVPWSGLHYSERIWRNKNAVATYLKENISKALIRGIDVRKIARDGELRKMLQTQEKGVKYNTERLVRTEIMYVRNTGTVDAYKASNVVEVVEISTAGDDRTCVECDERDGEIVPLNYAVAGDTIPPFHPQCRCCIIPVTNSET